MYFTMAQRYIRLERESKNIKFWIHERQSIAEKWRQVEFKAAVRIQSWFRGTRLRCYFRILNRQIIIIQKVWRGVLGRKAYLSRLRVVVRQSEYMYYNKKATVLQKVFRGWFVRSHIFDFYVWKNYFVIIGQKNEALRKQVNDYWSGDQNPKVLENQRLLKLLKYENKKKHYLMSTDVQPGIYQQEKHPEYAQIESWIKRMKPAVKGDRIDRTKRFSILTKMPPTVNPIKRQGPFKNAQQIYSIKNKPKIPLRMEDDVEGGRVYSEREIMREKGHYIHDKPFNTRDSKPCTGQDYSIFLSRMRDDARDVVKSAAPDYGIHDKEFQVPTFPDPIGKLFEKRYGDYSDVV